MLPFCSMGGLATTCFTRSSGEPSSPQPPWLAWTCPMIWISSPEPGETWMYPDPVATLSSTDPLTCRVLSNVPSAASMIAGEAASAIIAIHRICIVCLLRFFLANVARRLRGYLEDQSSLLKNDGVALFEAVDDF